MLCVCVPKCHDYYALIVCLLVILGMDSESYFISFLKIKCWCGIG